MKARREIRMSLSSRVVRRRATKPRYARGGAAKKREPRPRVRLAQKLRKLGWV